jgi:hypothetical protein
MLWSVLILSSANEVRSAKPKLKAKLGAGVGVLLFRSASERITPIESHRPRNRQDYVPLRFELRDGAGIYGLVANRNQLCLRLRGANPKQSQWYQYEYHKESTAESDHCGRSKSKSEPQRHASSCTISHLT